MEVISALVLGGPLTQSRVSAKFGVLVFKASLLWYLGRGPLAKVGSSAKFCVVVCRSSLLWYWGVHWPEYVCLPSLVHWYLRHLCSGTWEGAIGQSRFICQILCSGIQGISALVPGGSIGQSRVICQLLCSGMQVISALVLWGPLAQSRVIHQLLCSGMQVISPLVLGGPLIKVGSS